MNPSSLPSSSTYCSPVYPEPPHITECQHKQKRKKKQRIICYICKNRHISPKVRQIGPYLIHHTKPDLILVCPCLHRAHPSCLKDMGTDFICNLCNSIYPSQRFIRSAQLLCLFCHLLSLASIVGLVFGLSYLGRALDELGLGNEMGPKLDGDETWQDHEMKEIVEWLNIVHFATGVAGEALLGLVYIVGVYLLIGQEGTLVMVSNILYVAWPKRFIKPKWLNTLCVLFSLFVLGLVLGTYLLFFSWIWASVLFRVRKRFMELEMHQRHADIAV